MSFLIVSSDNSEANNKPSYLKLARFKITLNRYRYVSFKRVYYKEDCDSVDSDLLGLLYRHTDVRG